MHHRQRRLARHQDQLAPLLQMHLGRAMDQVGRWCRGPSRSACRWSKGKSPCRRSGTSRWRSAPSVSVMVIVQLAVGSPSRRPAHCSFAARMPASERSMSQLGSPGSVRRRAAAAGAEILQVDRQIQFLLEHGLRGGADRQMDVAAGGDQHFQQPHGIGHAAGAGDRKDEFRFISCPRTKWPRPASTARCAVAPARRPASARPWLRPGESRPHWPGR